MFIHRRLRASRSDLMSSTKFTTDLEDLAFVLFDQLDVDQALKKFPAYESFDEDLYRATLEEAARLGAEVLHPINGPGDREACHFDPETGVTTPQGFKQAWNELAGGGWVAVNAPPEAGGTGLPHCMAAAVSEIFSGSAMAFTMYMGLTGAAARVVHEFGRTWSFGGMVAQKMFGGQWGGTMCLTEAGAGSDVGANRCRATATDEAGVYHLEGEKIFISAGDHDLTENIVHLVLARTPDAPAGTKGLGLFLVPKFLFDENGTLGARNDARVVGIEHKMGINGSATCTLALGAKGTCKAWLIGGINEGIDIMFHMMNEARIGVGTQGLAVGAAAFQFSRHYVHERLQGSSIRNFKDASAPRVAIIEHPDVRRMLMTQKVLVEGMRSFGIKIAHRHDLAMHTDDPAEKKRLMGVVELLVPVMKAHCTDVGFDVAVTAVQIFGGYGYIGEYPVEQLVRDGKIMSIYEGTNGIQAMDLLGRKMRIGSGALFMQWMQEAQELCAKGEAAGFGASAGAINKAIQSLGAAAMHLGGKGMQGDLDGAMLYATPFLKMFGTVQLAIELLDQAIVARRVAGERGASAFLKGKELNVDFYVAHILPQATALGKTIQSNDASCLDAALFAS
jgi:alkylation response protein AidB-like acyl-CoA dehydrogenase